MSSHERALKSMKEVKGHIKEKARKLKKTGWEETGTGSRFIPKQYR